MRLLYFAVKGYKNLTTWVNLDNLQSINIIHGDNNVGKSNLLEAIQLGLMYISEKDIMSGSSFVEWLPKNIKTADIFTLSSPYTIYFQMHLSIEKAIFTSFGIDLNSENLSAYIEFQADFQGINALPRWIVNRVVANGVVMVPNIEAMQTQSTLYYAYKQAFNLIFSRKTNWYDYIGIHREVSSPEGSSSTSRSLIPPELQDTSWEYRDSLDAMQKKRWDLLQSSMQNFSDILGEGTLNVVWPRQNPHATFILDAPTRRIPAYLLGSGIQQVIGLLSRIIIRPATILMVEEPEQNLRYDLQKRLHKALEELTQNPQIGIQLFLTSHSPAFESGDSFYAMEMGPQGPVIHKRKNTEARAFLRIDTKEAPDHLPTSYLSKDGLVEVPRRIRTLMGLEKGGGVAFVQRQDGIIEMLTDAQFVEKFGGDDGQE